MLQTKLNTLKIPAIKCLFRRTQGIVEA